MHIIDSRFRGNDRISYKVKCKKDRGQGIGVRGQRIKIAAGCALAMTEEGSGKENGGVKLVLTRMRIVTAASCIRLLQG